MPFATHLFGLIQTAQAAGSPVVILAPTGEPSAPPSPFDLPATLVKVFNSGLDIILLIAGILAVFYLVWAGIQYISAGGSAEKTKVARAAILHAVIGIIVIVASYTIVNLAVTLGNFANNAAETSTSPAPNTSSSSSLSSSGASSNFTGDVPNVCDPNIAGSC